MTVNASGRDTSAPWKWIREGNMENAAGISITPSCGNVFLDIGFSPEEAAELTTKSDLIIILKETIERRGFTQKEAAKICGTDQPTLSKIFRGRLESVTIDRLVAWLTALGRPVEIHITPYSARATKKRFVSVVDTSRRVRSTSKTKLSAEKKRRNHA